ncbi:MAG TPA: MAPEG family protein [Xanthomonadaceae bacterium]|nr:MAPEG family protein [Xanthomonadaceae bacterium]
MSFPVTSLYAGLLALLIVFLALRVVVVRRHVKVGLGVGEGGGLEQRVRVHANAIENIPIALILLLLLELGGLGSPWLHAFGATLVVARILHAWGLSQHRGVSFGRFVGTLATWLAIIAMAGILLVRGVS